MNSSSSHEICGDMKLINFFEHELLKYFVERDEYILLYPFLQMRYCSLSVSALFLVLKASHYFPYIYLFIIKYVFIYYV